MLHIDEDKLLEYALEVCSNAEEYERIQTHLAGCPQCRESLAKIKSDLKFMGSIRPATSPQKMPTAARRNFSYVLARSAALILFGVLIGFGLALISRPEPIFVLPAYNRPAHSTLSEYGLAASEATAVKINYSNASTSYR